jgi:hypothetical protein
LSRLYPQGNQTRPTRRQSGGGAIGLALPDKVCHNPRFP